MPYRNRRRRTIVRLLPGAILEEPLVQELLEHLPRKSSAMCCVRTMGQGESFRVEMICEGTLEMLADLSRPARQSDISRERDTVSLMCQGVFLLPTGDIGVLFGGDTEAFGNVDTDD
jgi:hypothetical protein